MLNASTSVTKQGPIPVPKPHAAWEIYQNEGSLESRSSVQGGDAQKCLGKGFGLLDVEEHAIMFSGRGAKAPM